MFRQHEARVDEVDRAVAVAILEHDARFEEVRERGGKGRGVGALLAGARERAHGRERDGQEEEARVHTREFISTKQKGIA